MSTIRATFVQHGSSPVPNITLNASGQVIVASGIVSSGTFAAPSGSVSAPGLYFVGDSNTGIYSPAADTIAFTEGGVEALRIDSSGRVGIGTTSPSQALHVVGTVQAVSTSSTAASNVGLRLSNSGDGTLFNGISFQGNYFSDLYFGRSGGADDLVVRNGSSELLRIQNGGRLLVGTSSARSNFYNQNATTAVQIEGTTLATASLSITRNSNSASSADLILAKTRGTSVGDNTVVQNGDLLGYIAFQGADGTECVDGAAIECRVDGTPGANDMPGRLIFSTTADGASSPTERMRITNDGYALFNTTNKALRDSTSDVGLSIDPGAGGLLQLAAGGPTYFNRVSSDGSIIAFRRNGANVGSISVTGSATAYNTSSDYRLKENVTAVTDGIVRLQQLKPSRFNFIADPSTTVDGFIAHEVQTVVPEAIYGEKDEVDSDGNPIYQGIDQSKLVPLLTAALQEAVAKIESLEARLTAADI